MDIIENGFDVVNILRLRLTNKDFTGSNTTLIYYIRFALIV